MELELNMALDKIEEFVRVECGLSVSFNKSMSHPQFDDVVVHSSAGCKIATISAAITKPVNNIVGTVEAKTKHNALKINLFNHGGTCTWDANEVDTFLMALKEMLINQNNV